MIESRVPELISGVPEPISGVPTSATPGATGQSGVLVDGFHYTSTRSSSHSHVHNGNLNSYLNLGLSILSTVEDCRTTATSTRALLHLHKNYPARAVCLLFEIIQGIPLVAGNLDGEEPEVPLGRLLHKNLARLPASLKFERNIKAEFTLLLLAIAQVVPSTWSWSCRDWAHQGRAHRVAGPEVP